MAKVFFDVVIGSPLAFEADLGNWQCEETDAKWLSDTLNLPLAPKMESHFRTLDVTFEL